MAGYGQFCAVARAHEVLGGRWTLLVVRELLCGSRRFNDIRRGIPRISRTMLSERLQALAAIGAVERVEPGPEYLLTKAGRELAGLVGALGHWGQRWLPRRAEAEDLDLEPLLVDLRRRVDFDALPRDPLVVRFEIRGHPQHFLLLTPAEASLCTHNPGFPEPLCVQGPLAALVAWWRGDTGFAEARRMGLTVQGPRVLARAFPGWFLRYQLAGIAPAAVPAELDA
ncbi:winged helix-turn-helix transcriptional regulator [Inquilinus sp. OTU3971]|uniref:winged helix-turn-helix transcriptional regulator n=1 Tax=Inquilinus sp. OTU3971 TaxID=3043855 RepID=UPI00313F0387